MGFKLMSAEFLVWTGNVLLAVRLAAGGLTVVKKLKQYITLSDKSC